eukprot:1335421-Prymnesium_polylepis.1
MQCSARAEPERGEAGLERNGKQCPQARAATAAPAVNPGLMAYRIPYSRIGVSQDHKKKLEILLKFAEGEASENEHVCVKSH